MCSFSVVVDGRGARVRRGRSTARYSGRVLSSEARRLGRHAQAGARAHAVMSAVHRHPAAGAATRHPAFARERRKPLCGACGRERATEVARESELAGRELMAHSLGRNYGDSVRSGGDRRAVAWRTTPRAAAFSAGELVPSAWIRRDGDAHATPTDPLLYCLRAARPRGGRDRGRRARSARAWRCAPRGWVGCRGPTGAARHAAQASSSRRNGCRADRA